MAPCRCRIGYISLHQNYTVSLFRKRAIIFQIMGPCQLQISGNPVFKEIAGLPIVCRYNGSVFGYGIYWHPVDEGGVLNGFCLCTVWFWISRRRSLGMIPGWARRKLLYHYLAAVHHSQRHKDSHCTTDVGPRSACKQSPPSVGALLGQRLCHWSDIDPTVGRCLTFAGIWLRPSYTHG